MRKSRITRELDNEGLHYTVYLYSELILVCQEKKNHNILWFFFGPT